MISRYNSTCVHCNKPTKAGIDEYDVEMKTSFHEACHQKQDLFSRTEAERLAGELGYRRYTWDELE